VHENEKLNKNFFLWNDEIIANCTYDGGKVTGTSPLVFVFGGGLFIAAKRA
jgi:hypothetical protein